MNKGNFYFLSDEYCEKFSKYGVMANKETIADGTHRRPCYYAVQDIKNDGLEFEYVQGREAAFFKENICPVTERYIVEKNIDEKTGKDVSIPNDLMRKIDAKAKK